MTSPNTATPITGGPGNDTLPGRTGGSTTYEGNAGNDTVDHGTIMRRPVNFVDNGDGSSTLTHQDESTNTLRNIEKVEFVDGSHIFDLSHPVIQVVRLYQAALDRMPEQAGLNFHASSIEDGATLATVATGFLNSPEFQARYGISLPPDQFIARLYANVLDRAPSASEVGFYRDLLAQGTTREQLLVNFAESPENIAKTAPLVAAGVWDVSENAALVARLYDTMFSRLPEVAGLDYYRELLDAGALVPTQVVKAFTSSPEFTALYGAGVTNAAFVDLLYINSLGRTETPEERAYYTTNLDSGALAREDVVLAFSESPEHVALTKENILSDNPGQFGILFAG